jgi:hypothetical protein
MRFKYLARQIDLDFLRVASPSCAEGFNGRDRSGQCYFARLAEQLGLAPAVSVSLLQQIAQACPRLSSAQQSKLATDIDRFIEARSWTDLAIGLVRLELPTWQIRRIACKGSEWTCSLLRQPYLPLSLDESALWVGIRLTGITSFVARRMRRMRGRPMRLGGACSHPRLEVVEGDVGELTAERCAIDRVADTVEPLVLL